MSKGVYLLSKLEHQVLCNLISLYQELGYKPTLADIGEMIGKTTTEVDRAMSELELKGYIERPQKGHLIILLDVDGSEYDPRRTA